MRAVERLEKVGRRGHIRIARTVSNWESELSAPVRCEVVYDAGRWLTVKPLAPGPVGWNAGDTYRCPTGAFVPDVPRVNEVVERVTIGAGEGPVLERMPTPWFSTAKLITPDQLREQARGTEGVIHEGTRHA